MLRHLWQRYRLWRVKRRIIRELHEAARLFDATHDDEIARRMRDRAEVIRQSAPGKLHHKSFEDR